MNLNYHCARHQLSLINAKEATSNEARLAHRRLAAPYADQVNARRRNLPAGSASAL